MSTINATRPLVDTDRAVRLIYAFAARAARQWDSPVDHVSQKRRELSTRLWADVDPTDFQNLVSDIHELRASRRAGWDTQWDSPMHKDQWLGQLKDLIHRQVTDIALTAKWGA